MLLVILGAGASYDSDPSRLPPFNITAPDLHRDRLPLAQHLFDQRFNQAISRYPQCTPIIDRLRRAVDTGILIETKLSEFEAESDDYPQRNIQLAAIRFYLRHIVDSTQAEWFVQCAGVTNYATLVDQLERLKPRRQRVCYVTFNYDTLLEHGITAAVTGRQFRHTWDYLARPGPIVIKPHGSANWKQTIGYSASLDPFLSAQDRVQQEQLLIEHLQDIIVSPRVHIHEDLDYTPTLHLDNGHPTQVPELFLPAIALPYDRKDEFVCPPEQLQTLQNDVLPIIKHILIIGWRATEATFIELLAQRLSTNVTGTIVNGGAEFASHAANNLKEQGVHTIWEETPLSFSTFLNDFDLASLFR